MQELYWLDFRGYWPIKPLPTSMGRTLTSPAQFIIIFLPLVSACTYSQGLESKTIFSQYSRTCTIQFWSTFLDNSTHTLWVYQLNIV